MDSRNITFGYQPDKKIIKNVTFRLKPGKITALIGANGCGKTTLFKLLTGIERPEMGEISLQGVNIQKMKQKEFAKKVAVVHQYNTAPSDLTVRKLVEMGRTPHRSVFGRTKKEQDVQAVEQALSMTNTKQYEHQLLSQLSGGQKQRAWLAMALAQKPEILLLDEITTYLDIRYQIELLSLIRKLNQEQHLTVLMVLHDINQAMEYADEVVVMKSGEIIACGETEEVVTEQVLNEAFSVKTEIVQLKGQNFCLFKRK